MAKAIYVSPTGSDSNSGESAASPIKSLSVAAGRAQPGDTVNLLAGRYLDPLIPTRSGTRDQPIVFRSASSQPAVITHGSVSGLKHAILLSQVSDIVIEGIHVDGVKPAPDASVNTFVHIEASTRVVVRKGVFRYANGWAGVDVRGSTYVTIEDNVIERVGQYRASDGHGIGDAVQVRFDNPQYVLIRRNVIRKGGHDLLRVDGQFVVVEDNVFNNDFRDEFGTTAGYRSVSLNGTNNVFQRNKLALSGIGGAGTYAPLQTGAGVGNIVRHNIYLDGFQEAISSECGAGAKNASTGRFYNNTALRLGGPAWGLRWYSDGICYAVGDIAFVNNLIVDSRKSPRSSFYDTDIFFETRDSPVGATAGNVAKGNMFSPADGKAPTVTISQVDGRISLAEAEKRYPAVFSRNKAGRPKFVKESPSDFPDFELLSGSPGVDEGVFLTRASSGGRSATLPVEDPSYFTNGFGLVAGDLVQLAGSTTRVRVLAVDHAAKALRLETAIDFVAGQGVTLAYSGAAPDVGARESALGTSVPQSPLLIVN
jgi:hypothetical protein